MCRTISISKFLSFSVSLSLSYDNLFVNGVCEGDHTKAKLRAEKIVNLAQVYFHDSESLGTNITLDIKEIEYTDHELRLREENVECDSMCTL